MGKVIEWDLAPADFVLYVQSGELKLNYLTESDYQSALDYGWTDAQLRASDVGTSVLLLRAGNSFSVPAAMRIRLEALSDVEFFTIYSESVRPHYAYVPSQN